MIKLRRLGSVGMWFGYARTMEANKIRHYYVSYAKTLVGDKTAEELIKEYVAKETEEEIEIEPVKITNAYGVDSFGVQEAKDVLENIPKVKKQLEKREVKSCLYQYNRRSPWWQYLFNPIAIPYNWLINKINTKWAERQWKKLGPWNTRFEYLALLSKIKHLPYLPVSGEYRCVTPCRYLTISFEESDRSKAIEIFQRDLKILADKKLIMGHLAKPFYMQLADTIGSGQQAYALACFLFLDDRRLEKIVGKKKWQEEGYKPFALNVLLGLKTETLEGGISDTELNPNKKYVIETVNICEGERQANWDAYVKSYDEQQEALKKIEKRNVEWENKFRGQKYTDAQLETLVSEVETELNKSINADVSTLVSDKEEQ